MFFLNAKPTIFGCRYFHVCIFEFFFVPVHFFLFHFFFVFNRHSNMFSVDCTAIYYILDKLENCLGKVRPYRVQTSKCHVLSNQQTDIPTHRRQVKRAVFRESISIDSNCLAQFHERVVVYMQILIYLAICKYYIWRVHPPTPTTNSSHRCNESSNKKLQHVTFTKLKHKFFRPHAQKYSLQFRVSCGSWFIIIFIPYYSYFFFCPLAFVRFCELDVLRIVAVVCTLCDHIFMLLHFHFHFHFFLL